MTPIRRTTFHWWAAMRLLLLTGSAVFLLLLATTQGRLDARFVLSTLLTTFVYTFSIGPMSLYVTRQFIEPAAFGSEVKVWSTVILSSLGMAVLGTAVAEFILVATGMFRGQTFSERFGNGIKISLVVSLVVATGTYAYDRMRKRLQSQNVDLQKAIELDTARARQQEEEVQKAREIQEGLLPNKIAQVPGFEVSGVWQPAWSVGGDYYDVVRFDDSSLGMAIADVVGKGISAALLMANLQAAFRAFAADGRSPAEVCGKINSVMCCNVASGKFITMFYAVLDAAQHTLVYSNAGHNAPILLRGADTFRLEEGGALLGVFPDWKYGQGRIGLQSGDRILLFTDGLNEAEDPDGQEFGEERLIQTFRLLRDRPAAEIQAGVLGAVRDFCRGNFRDDATLLVVAAL